MNTAISILGFIKSNWKGCLIFLAAFTIAFQTWSLNRLQEKYNTDMADKDKALELKDGEIAKMVLRGNKVGTNTGEGPSYDYRPPEGNMDVILSENKEVKAKLAAAEAKKAELLKNADANVEEIEKLNKAIAELDKKRWDFNVNVQKWGLTKKLGIGILYFDKKLHPEIDIKWLFWRRYSLKSGATLKFLHPIGISRHVDDLVPWFKFDNLELQGGLGLDYEGWKKLLVIGLRLNL